MLLAHPQSGAITLRTAMQRYFEVALYLLVLTGFGTLGSTGGLVLLAHYVAGGRCRALPWILARYAAQLPDSRAVDHRSYSRLCRVLFSGLFFHFRRFP